MKGWFTAEACAQALLRMQAPDVALVLNRCADSKFSLRLDSIHTCDYDNQFERHTCGGRDDTKTQLSVVSVGAVMRPLYETCCG